MTRRLLLACAVGCGDGGAGAPPDAGLRDASPDASPDERPAANPLGVDDHLLPFPCAYYLAEDATAKTGVRLALREDDAPATVKGLRTDPTAWNRADGFSPAAPILVHFDVRVDPSSLPSIRSPGESLDPGSPTVILDMETGDRVPHFAEVDARAEPDEPQALILRPMQRLATGRRHAVAVTRDLRAADGSPLDPPPGFAAILDGTAGPPGLDRIRDRYPDIFAALEADGLAREDLLLAFDFVTASEDFLSRDLVAMRERALAYMGERAENLDYEITFMEENPAADTLRVIEGTYEVPMFLEGGERGYAGFGRLARDEDGLPERVRLWDGARFTLILPRVAESVRPLPLLQYGHGLLGSSDEARSDWLREFTNRYGWATVAHDWMGLMERDVAAAIRALTEPSTAPILFERMEQGMVNAIALTRLARFGMSADEATWVAGEPAIDAADPVVYYGNSLGGVFGTTLMAWSPDIERGLLGVGGANWSLMMERSVNWPEYELVMSMAFPGRLDQLVAISLMQALWDTTDALGAAAHLLGDPYPATAAKKILMQAGIGDAQVPNIATDVAARTAGIDYLGPPVRDVYRIEPMDGPLDSALTYWRYEFEPDKTNDVGAKDNPVHEAVRRTPAAQCQAAAFLRGGRVAPTCDGACDCTTAACEPRPADVCPGLGKE